MLNLPFVLCCTFLYISIGSATQTVEPTVTVTVSPNHVPVGGVAAIECLVSDPPSSNEIGFSRLTATSSEPLTSNGNLITADERIFLAKRNHNMHVLTIINVVREDEGDYICGVSDAGMIMTSKAYLTVQYFPTTGPSCSMIKPMSPQYSNTVTEGSPIHLNCSSEEGYPAVDLVWTRGATAIDPVQIQRRGSGIFTEIYLTARVQDNNDIFICKMTSRSFPDEVKSCHLGPLRVIPNPDKTTPPATTTMSPEVEDIATTTAGTSADQNSKAAGTSADQNSKAAGAIEKCMTFCSALVDLITII